MGGLGLPLQIRSAVHDRRILPEQLEIQPQNYSLENFDQSKGRKQSVISAERHIFQLEQRTQPEAHNDSMLFIRGRGGGEGEKGAAGECHKERPHPSGRMKKSHFGRMDRNSSQDSLLSQEKSLSFRVEGETELWTY